MLQKLSSYKSKSWKHQTHNYGLVTNPWECVCMSAVLHGLQHTIGWLGGVSAFTVFDSSLLKIEDSRTEGNMVVQWLMMSPQTSGTTSS